MSGHHESAPVRFPFLTPGVYVLLCLAGTGAAIALYRFFTGIGSVANLNTQYPWGIWIAIDVASGVALAAGGFTTAALAHILHRGHYEAVTRPALLTAMLGYTFVSLGLLVDLGRYYNIWHPLVPTMWQGNSVLFEVGTCVSCYLTVLYLEFMPIVCERFVGKVNLPGPLAGLNGLVDGILRLAQRWLGKIMFLLIIAGVVLSCMHQSSLGALMLIAPYKMHALWYTPILPMLFLMSAIAVGFPMVVVESMWASWAFKRKPEMEVLTPLSRFTILLLGLYIVAKVGDLVVRQQVGLLLEGSVASYMWMVEMGFGVVLPFLMLVQKRVRSSPKLLLTACALIVGGVVVNRINVFLVAYQPPYAEKAYFPSIQEILITVGLISTLALLYRAAVTILPVLPRDAGETGDMNAQGA